MELNNSTQKDVLDRLADAEKLVLELKDIISKQDAQLQQKDEALQVLSSRPLAEYWIGPSIGLEKLVLLYAELNCPP